jgi:hypothetical protein
MGKENFDATFNWTEAMKRLLLLTILLAFSAAAVAAEKPPTKIWNRTGPLGDTPKHVTDSFPLSDQENKGGWIKFEPMTDEFEGKELDRNKWHVGMEWWKGRQPALFSDKNVTVSDGKLHLTMRKEKLPPEAEKWGYKDYTSAALHTKARSSYGYYEVMAKPMNSGGSSSFWFQQDETPGWSTEIDSSRLAGARPHRMPISPVRARISIRSGRRQRLLGGSDARLLLPAPLHLAGAVIDARGCATTIHRVPQVRVRIAPGSRWPAAATVSGIAPQRQASRRWSPDRIRISMPHAWISIRPGPATATAVVERQRRSASAMASISAPQHQAFRR